MAAAARADRTAATAVTKGAVLFLLALTCACGWFRGPDAAYQEVVTRYRRGDLAGAAAEASANAERWRGNRSSPWYWKFRSLAADIAGAAGNYRQAEEWLRDPPPAGLADANARWLLSRANLEVARNRDASDLLRRARALAVTPELASRVDLPQGVAALNRWKSAEADDLFQSALRHATLAKDVYLQASALNELCISRRRLNRNEEAVRYGERSAAAAARIGALRLEATAHSNLGTAYSLLGDFDAALAHERKAIDLQRGMGARPNLMFAVGELAFIYDAAGQSAKSIPFYRQAFQMAQDLGSQPDATRFAENLALALIKTENWPEAEAWNARAAQLAAVTRVNLAYLKRNQALIAEGTNRTADAIRLYRDLLAARDTPEPLRWVAFTQLGDIDARAGRFRQANGEYQQALALIDGSRAALTDARFQITLVSHLIPFYRHYVYTLARENDDAGALRVIESSRARVLARRMGRDFEPQRFPGLAGLRRWAAAQRVTALSFWVGQERSFAWVIRPDAVRRIELPGEDEIQAAVTQYRAVVEHSVRDPMTVEPRLWRELMAPVAAAIPPGSRVIVIADGPLHRLNLETLVRPDPRPHYWLEDAQLQIAPSLTIAMGKPAEAAGKGVLLIGDPDYRGTGYEPLAGAGPELRAIAAQFAGGPEAVYSGARAIPAAYRQAEPGRYAVIHFAAHAEADPERPLDSAVVLTRQGDEARLYARDVIGIPLHAALVTLSACRGAGAREYGGEGLVGFAWAFLQAGAAEVVAGLWDVNDRSSAALMARFYRGIAAGQPPAVALHAAKLEMRADPHFQKAFYWGAFQAYAGAVSAPAGPRRPDASIP